MDFHLKEDQDEDIFIGQMTLKEVRKHVLPVYHRQTVGCVNISDDKDDTNTSFKIIQTHSAPDITSKADLLSPALGSSGSSPELSPETVCESDIKSDDSFFRHEQMANRMCDSPEKSYQTVGIKMENTTNKYFFIKSQIGTNSDNTQVVNSDNVTVNVVSDDEADLPFKTPIKVNNMKSALPNSPCTPQAEIFKTPSTEMKSKTPIFKTPGNPLSQIKLATPSRKYQNVVSPVATYIRNCPQVPLLKDVYPKRNLPGVSSIPKPVRHISQLNLGNKENIEEENKKPEKQTLKLPAVAYRTAKETKLIDVPVVSKMPQSQWAKHVASSIPRAMVVKHNHRETSSLKNTSNLRQEDSFADLSLHQADLSVCTRKIAFSKPKK